MKTRFSSDRETYRRQAVICKALANPTRLHLIALLGRDGCWSSDLQHGLGISKANLSQHLSILKSAGMVSTHREGKQLYCDVSMPQVIQATTLLRDMLKKQLRAARRLL
jgi:DNA-binding transcriptional ArsR family regulator